MSISVDVSAQLYGLPPQGHPLLTMLIERKHKAKCGCHMQRILMLMFSNLNKSPCLSRREPYTPNSQSMTTDNNTYFSTMKTL